MTEPEKKSFEEAGQEKEVSLLAEFFTMLKENKKYWMIPIILILLGFGLLIMMGGSAAAPFIYQIF